jgi:uncharacterized membrane protein YqaE (UPF0057 family)
MGIVIANLFLTLLGILPGSIHAMTNDGLSCMLATLICFLPPVALFLVTTSCNKQVLICALLWLTIFGGTIYAFWKTDAPPEEIPLEEEITNSDESQDDVEKQEVKKKEPKEKKTRPVEAGRKATHTLCAVF